MDNATQAAAPTPGPWAAVNNEVFAVDEDGTRFALVAKVGPAFGAYAELRIAANASAIAALPDLLELAHAFREYVYDGSRSERRAAECLRQCDAAIAKAEGK